jgi:hypothetical protein
MACSTACIYDTEGELLPVYEHINSDESDNYEDIDERDGLGATDSISLADEAEDHLVPPNVSKCFAALSDLPMREANFLASESRDMFAEGDSNKTNEVFQETLAPSDFCNTWLEASGVNRYRWWRGLAQMTGFTLVFSKLAYLWTGGH